MVLKVLGLKVRDTSGNEFSLAEIDPLRSLPLSTARTQSLKDNDSREDKSHVELVGRRAG